MLRQLCRGWVSCLVPTAKKFLCAPAKSAHVSGRALLQRTARMPQVKDAHLRRDSRRCRRPLVGSACQRTLHTSLIQQKFCLATLLLPKMHARLDRHRFRMVCHVSHANRKCQLSPSLPPSPFRPLPDNVPYRMCVHCNDYTVSSVYLCLFYCETPNQRLVRRICK